MDIKLIDKKHANDINIPNEPFLLRGKLIVEFKNNVWSHKELLFESDEIKEMAFPDEYYDFNKMKDYVFVGAYENNTCIGLAILTETFNSCLFLYDLKVNKLMRGKGVGKKLIDYSYKHALDHNYPGLFTIAQDNNLDACLFYLACGFEIGGIDTKSYEKTKQKGKYDIYFYKYQ